jgi:perosamine synthetase
MVGLSTVPCRCVNLPPGTMWVLLSRIGSNRLQSGPELEQFDEQFVRWLGVPHVFGTNSGRLAFRPALDALDLKPGAEIIFPTVTFPVIPMVAKTMGYAPVFCEVDPCTFNAGPEQITPKMTDRTGAIVATHLFEQACPIDRIVTLALEHGIRVLEDCAHVCGVRIDGRQVGTFGDVGVFSFAEGKNMPCLGGGAMVTADDAVAERAAAILSKAPQLSKGAILKMAVATWGKWLLTRPSLFGFTVYPVLRLKLRLGQSLMDSAVGDELLEDYPTPPQSRPLSNLQATIGLLHQPCKGGPPLLFNT